jgi:hypothetical protein
VSLPKSAVRLVVLPLLLGLAAGCEDQDSNPAGPGGPSGDSTADLQAFQDQAVMAFETANGVAGGVDEIARGDLSQIVSGLGMPQGSARAADFVWDAAQGAWILSDQGTESDSTGTATWSIWAWIQFRDAAGAPQMEPDSTTASLAIDLDWDIAAQAQENGETFAMDVDYASELAVSGLPHGPYPVDGSGTISGRLLWTGFGEEDLDVTFAMGWDMELVVPDADGCPTGTMTVWVDEYEATATYNGTTTYDWVMTQNGAVVATGSEPLACGAPAGTIPVRAWDRWSALRPE